MLRFTSQKQISSITRISGYVGGISSSTSVSGGTCYLRPLSDTESSDNGFQYGKAFSAIFEPDFDIRPNDEMTIEGQKYTVRGVSAHDRGGYTKYKRALVTLPEA